MDTWLDIEKMRFSLNQQSQLLVGHFVDLLLHHVPAAVDQSFRDAWYLFGGVLYVGGEFERDGAEGAGWDEFDVDDAWRFFFDVGDHLHFGEAHACFWVLDFADFFADFVFHFCQTLFHTLVSEVEMIKEGFGYKLLRNLNVFWVGGLF